MLGQERLDAVGAEPPPVQVGEQGAGAVPRRLVEPRPESDSGVPCQWGASFLPAFADAPHVRAGAEMDGVPVQADQLGEAQAGLGREQQQGVVAAAEPRRPVGRGKDRFDLDAREEMHFTLIVSLARYREHALDEGTVSRLFEGYKPEEEADGSQAQVACRDAGAALRLEIGQERADERRVQLIER